MVFNFSLSSPASYSETMWPWCIAIGRPNTYVVILLCMYMYSVFLFPGWGVSLYIRLALFPDVVQSVYCTQDLYPDTLLHRC